MRKTHLLLSDDEFTQELFDASHRNGWERLVTRVHAGPPLASPRSALTGRGASIPGLVDALQKLTPRDFSREMVQALMVIDDLLARTLGSVGAEMQTLLYVEHLAYAEPKEPNYFREHVAHALRVLWVGLKLLNVNPVWGGGWLPAIRRILRRRDSPFKRFAARHGKAFERALDEGLEGDAPLVWRVWLLSAIFHDLGFRLWLKNGDTQKCRSDCRPSRRP